MKRLIAIIAILICLGGCVAQQRTVTPLSLSMMLLNQGQPFLSATFAERLALLVLDEKYPKGVFSPRGRAVLEDKGDICLVTFENALVSSDDTSALPLSDGKIIPRRLTITIRKANGEIVAIS